MAGVSQNDHLLVFRMFRERLKSQCLRLILVQKGGYCSYLRQLLQSGIVAVRVVSQRLRTAKSKAHHFETSCLFLF